jgi:hypothetical protein
MQAIRRMSGVKRGALVALALVSVGVLLAACAPAKPPPPPPPPPTDPHDVLVVGDSIAYSFGCVLGDASGGPGPCPSPGGFTTHNEIVGGCTISGGTILLYNGTPIDSYGCQDWPSAWAAHADTFTPKVVVIVTSGWEIMDRWSGAANGLPDRQWGGNSTDFQNARNAYQASLAGAINLFRQRGAKVIVANSAYMNPPEAQFPPGTAGAPDFLINAWYERYPDDGNVGPDPDPWNAPIAGMTYRPSKFKVDQFNASISSVVSGFGSDVVKFDFFKHFDPGNAYNDYVCPPPNDSTDVPNPTTHQCTNGAAILARDTDRAHLTQSGGHSILATYLVPCVRAVLAGDPPTACS